jgi:hypothetical protein
MTPDTVSGIWTATLDSDTTIEIPKGCIVSDIRGIYFSKTLHRSVLESPDTVSGHHACPSNRLSASRVPTMVRPHGMPVCWWRSRLVFRAAGALRYSEVCVGHS